MSKRTDYKHWIVSPEGVKFGPYRNFAEAAQALELNSPKGSYKGSYIVSNDEVEGEKLKLRDEQDRYEINNIVCHLTDPLDWEKVHGTVDPDE